jgi:alanyl-tRNA synthetase
VTGDEVRQSFLDYFRERGHTIVPSAPLVPANDPSLLFTNAGMVQFKQVFLGAETRPYTRAADSQKVLRISGKHNDLEQVGRDTYHHTFFEMLGNWSFGDYWKRDAIVWAWELLTGVWKLPKDKLYATVYTTDDEAAALWLEATDIGRDRVSRFEEENFWEMGDTGPCGPCSEIHIDRGPAACDKQDVAHRCEVNSGCARFIEIWNLVFIQYNRDDKGKLHPLPARHVDTGMGFERVTAVLQGKQSNYDTDVFSPVIDAIGELTGKRYGGKLDDLTDVAFRVIADHVRMLTFAITDGALPDNKGRGSVIRGILRRAVRFGWQQFEQREPFIYKLVPVLVEHMGKAYPELTVNPERVADVIEGEEADFLRTIERGLALFEDAAQRAQKAKGRVSGKDIFDLHTTYGFPPDLTRQMAGEQALTLDEKGYDKLMREHEEKSRGKGTAQQVALNVSGGLPATDDRPKWAGLRGEGTVLGWIAENQYTTTGKLPAGEQVGLVLDRTCFYAEAGGQVGDTGTIVTPTGVFEVSQTVKVGNAVAHVGEVSEGWLEVGQKGELNVNPAREFTRKNHTATHLLHWALRTVLGDHVEQRGSKVKPEEFTFDFSNSGPMTDEQKAEVERLVNERVYADLSVRWEELPIAQARKLPRVRAFFGDKYGDVVRVVQIGDGFSREFCGGTHLDHTGQIGYFKIVGEEPVGKGIRRLTCVTARAAVAAVQQEDAILAGLSGRFRCKPEELPARVEALQEEIKKLQQQLKKGAASDLQGAADKLLAAAAEVQGARVIVGEMPAGPDDQMRQQVDRLKQKAGSGVVVVGWADDGKVGLIAAVTDDLVKKGLHAGKLVGEVAKVVGGGGGGKPTMAQAGGKEPAKLGEALELAKKRASEQLAK